MYLTRLESFVLPGRVREMEALGAQWFELLARQPGFVRGGLSNSLGNPSKYINITLWESREAGDAARRSDEIQGYIRANPLTAVATVARPLEAFEVIQRVLGGDIGEAGYTVLQDITVEPSQIQAFEDATQELLDIRDKFGHGMIATALARFLGDRRRYLFYVVHTDREAARATLNTPENQAFLQRKPLSSLGGTVTAIDTAAVVRVFVPALVV